MFNTKVSGTLTVSGITLSFESLPWERVAQMVAFVSGADVSGGEEKPSLPRKGSCADVIRDILDSETGEFENRYVTSAEFRHAYPVLAEFSLREIGVAIGKIRVNRPEIQKEKVYVLEERKYENRFLLPMPKWEKDTAEVDVGGYSGALIRAMEENGIGAVDVANLTGYPLSAVNGWLDGTILPSVLAFQALRKVFGEDFLKNQKVNRR